MNNVIDGVIHGVIGGICFMLYIVPCVQSCTFMCI